MQRLHIPHAPYTLLWNDGYPYSVCEDFVTTDTELISAWRIMQTLKKSNSTSIYQHFVNCCQILGVSGIVPALDRMIVLDYLIANEDRHLNNFGLLRNPETLEWIGMAPIFNSGSSLGYDRTAPRIRIQQDIVCKPFKKNHSDQLKLVSSLDWIDFDALRDIDALVREALSGEQAKEFIGDDRIDAITETMEKRIHTLQTMDFYPSYTIDSTKDDVEENIAEDYTPKLSM